MQSKFTFQYMVQFYTDFRRRQNDHKMFVSLLL